MGHISENKYPVMYFRFSWLSRQNGDYGTDVNNSKSLPTTSEWHANSELRDLRWAVKVDFP